MEICTVRIFSTLTDADVLRVAHMFNEVSVEAGQPVWEGDAHRRWLHGIVAGRVGVSVLDASGAEVKHEEYGPGHYLGGTAEEMQQGRSGERTYRAVALEDVRLVRIARADLMRVLDVYPDVLFALAPGYLARGHDAFPFARALGAEKALARVRAISEIAGDMGVEELAEMAGTTRAAAAIAMGAELPPVPDLRLDITRAAPFTQLEGKDLAHIAPGIEYRSIRAGERLCGEPGECVGIWARVMSGAIRPEHGSGGLDGFAPPMEAGPQRVHEIIVAEEDAEVAVVGAEQYFALLDYFPDALQGLRPVPPPMPGVRAEPVGVALRPTAALKLCVRVAGLLRGLVRVAGERMDEGIVMDLAGAPEGHVADALALLASRGALRLDGDEVIVNTGDLPGYEHCVWEQGG